MSLCIREWKYYRFSILASFVYGLVSYRKLKTKEEEFIWVVKFEALTGIVYFLLGHTDVEIETYIKV